MRAIITGVFAMLLATSVASAREAATPNIRTDTRAPVTERMTMTDEEFTCTTGHATGWLALVGIGALLLLRRSPR